MQKLKKQFGVIPFIQDEQGLRLVLVSSRNSGVWIFPKGNRIAKKSKYDSAKQEAYEEAGIRGEIIKGKSYTAIQHRKTGGTLLELFPMRVYEVLDRWPEYSQRKRIVVSLEEARSLLAFDSLLTCKTSWMADFFDEGE